MTDLIALLTHAPLVFFGLVFIFSLMIGSFLNVVIYRLPKILEQGWKRDCREFLADELANPTQADKAAVMTLSTPASSCPNCQHKIRFYENIPLLSWLFLRGKCSQCQTKISYRYPLVELATGLLSLVIAAHYGVSLTTLFLLCLTWGLICLTLIDYDHMLLPDQITLPLLWLGLLVNINGALIPLSDAVIGAVVGYLSLYSVFWLFKLVTGKEGMGHGDFKLVAVFGAWLGWQLLPLLILMASLVGAIIGISLMVFSHHQREQAIPFGPYLAISGWITLLWGNTIWSWYLSFLS
ncbi:type 4 prepilin peptidase 1 Aspartic peptidase. MEROPS family A24A [Colwellia chukchiensis]|uniref:Prepilin leader peptidase/N-methyltransferase n=1 Tax=Colwellia chukchiensis TaxID=641665 RepID=A0A1H7L2Z7_9GAMM|nr:A24 family peptidase [Colwellia chukchiensis]SEK93409.1 type 4 prepilin peptidase 1 Aspartic peptidase. MEROPS family A24A [Colwellia chukchiensis]